MRTFALLDSASSLTLIRTELARSLGLSGPKRTITVIWTGTEEHEVVTEGVEVFVSGTNEADKFKVLANTMEGLSLPSRTWTPEMAHQEMLEDIPVEYGSNQIPQMLIGLDNVKLMATTDMQIGRSGQVIAGRTPLG